MVSFGRRCRAGFTPPEPVGYMNGGVNPPSGARERSVFGNHVSESAIESRYKARSHLVQITEATTISCV